MPYNRPLTLKVANRKDFAIPMGILFVLTIIAALLSPQPEMLTILVCLLFGAEFFSYILDFTKVNDVKFISVVFPDGRVRVEPDQEPDIVGFLSGQQWCTHHFAVLQYSVRGKQQYLLVLSAQQNVDEFRRLEVCLGEDFCSDIGEQPVSGN